MRRFLMGLLSFGMAGDEFGRRWCYWPLVLGLYREDCSLWLGVGLYLLRFRGEEGEPYLVGYSQLGIVLDPRAWRLGESHDYYDGPHCRYDFGPLAYATNQRACARCEDSR